jgi:hypothetical protein
VTPQPSDPNGGRARAAVRRAKALELRIAGMSIRDLAVELGVSSSQAHRDVQRELAALAAASQASAAELRELELARLDVEHARAVEAQAAQPDPRWTRELVRISDRRAKLLGLDAPARVSHQVDVSEVRVIASVAIRVGLSKFGAVIETLDELLAAGASVVDSRLVAEARELAVVERDAWLVELDAATAQLPSGETPPVDEADDDEVDDG